LKSFFQGEPDAEKMSRWRGTFSALARESVNPLFDEGVHDILAYLQKSSLEDLQHEYYKLFTDPFTDMGLPTTASYYLDGRNHDKTLVNLRSFLMEVEIARNEGVTETEDSLTVMLDIMTRLIEREDQQNKEAMQKAQEELLSKYLFPFSAGISEAAENNEFASFYRTCFRFFRGYLELEKGLTGSVAYPS
ncbi:MAG: molecular chaperone TorD family protein, partial [Desulfocapsaceae bacterium]|nr:molecular chaperone TorD family protein [Desulfocapsaceae bacterium]